MLNVLFFIIFILVCQYIMLNLFILILMQSFEQYYINEDNPLRNFQAHSDLFKQRWMRACDPDNPNFMSARYR